jgi:hypothetical protein
MKRNDNTIMWKKNGGGTFRLPSGKIIKPNQKFRARIDEIPKAFRDQIIPLEDISEMNGEVKAPEYNKQDAGLFYIMDEEGPVTDKTYSEEMANQIVEEGFERKAKQGGWIDLVDPSGDAINKKSLTSEDAEEIESAELYKEKAELFNIVDGQGKQVNEVPLSEEDADEMIKELIG